MICLILYARKVGEVGMIVIDSNMAKVPNICNECYANMWGSCCIAPAEEDGLCIQGGKPDWCPIKELVRCKDCKNRYDSMLCPIALIADLLHDTRVFQYKVGDDWFCADGERRTEE